MKYVILLIFLVSCNKRVETPCMENSFLAEKKAIILAIQQCPSKKALLLEGTFNFPKYSQCLIEDELGIAINVAYSCE